jgi:hypothetical protein
VDDQLLTVALRDVEEAQKVAALNRLLELNRISLLISPKGHPVYRFQTEEQASKLRDLLPEEVLVYQMIEESRDRGITVIDMKTKLTP